MIKILFQNVQQDFLVLIVAVHAYVKMVLCVTIEKAAVHVRQGGMVQCVTRVRENPHVFCNIEIDLV